MTRQPYWVLFTHYKKHYNTYNMSNQLITYNKKPFIEIQPIDGLPDCEWPSIAVTINDAIAQLNQTKTILVLDTYQGVFDDEIIASLLQQVNGVTDIFYTKDTFLPQAKLETLLRPYVTDDPIFGYMNGLTLADFMEPAAVKHIKELIEKKDKGVIVVYGPGASLLTKTKDILVYFDMPRWEIQQRFRNNLISNLGFDNTSTLASLQYKQSFFVDWRVCDRHKKDLLPDWDFVIDTTAPDKPVMITGKTIRTALEQTTARPFRFVPYFDPGPWGGQWMREKLSLPDGPPNYAWAFDCVAEENSIVYQIGDCFFETPGINLVFAAARPLLGEAVQARFGDEFPIRFDFLDTMGGGNLSLQVHPTTGYIQERFGMHYTQDESYYLLDAAPEAIVYLGMKNDIDPAAMIADLQSAQSGEQSFDADKYVQQWPAKKHDHFLIPAGTVHCSGKNSMVLEISATPYIFTFKLWDWSRMGLDGKPRPINIEHGKKVINWEITPDYTAVNLVNNVTEIASGDGWKEERTGLHERQFIETRRHWFSKKVTHHTYGSVNVLNLVEGEAIIVESPDHAFAPFMVSYAETFVIPAAVTTYTIRPAGPSEGKTCATIKAFVRTGVTTQI